MEIYTRHFILVIILVATNSAFAEYAFSCEDGWLQGSEDLDQYCYKVLGAEVAFYPQYMSFYQCKQECNAIGGKLVHKYLGISN